MATNSYSAGNLEMQIQAVGTNATASLSTVNQHLRTMVSLVGTTSSSFKALQQSLASISRLKFNSLDKLSSGLEKISQINTTNLYNQMSSISRVITPLSQLNSSISGVGQINTFANGLQKIVNLDVNKFTTQIQQLTTSLQPFLVQITNATPALNAFSTAMASMKGTRTIRFSQLTGGSGSGAGNKINRAFNFGKILSQLYFIRNYTQQIGRGIANMVQNAIDYTETLNLWQVAMGENIDQADEFIEKMNKAYGISEQTLMNYQATFRNMLAALGGISDVSSYALSEYLTQMALDYASLYNTSIERAMTVFQSVLSGQVRPIRTISGYDITETTIYQLYQQLGGTKSMRQLSQTEKRLLRIYAVFQQMETSGAIGDLNKTLGNSANQLRILNEALKELGTWIGIIFEMWIKPILPYLNAFVITLKNIIQALAQAMGYVPFEGAIESIEEYNDALDETTGKLLSFDRFEALNPSDENNALSIDTALLDGLSQYQSILDGVTNQATELAEKWTSWWVDADTGELTAQAQNLLNVLQGISIVLGTLIGLKISSSIINFLGSLLSINKILSLIVNHPIILALTALASIMIYLYNTNEQFRESINNLFTALSPLLNTVMSIIDIIMPIIKTLADLIIPIIEALTPILDIIIQIATVILNIILPPINMMLTGISAIIKLLTGDFTGAWDTIKEYFGMFKEYFINIWKSIANAFASIINGIVNGVIEVVNFIIRAINTLLKPVDAIAGIFGGNVQIPEITWRMNWKPYRNGGIVEDGMFTMSRGEIIGDFDDGTTVVANNMQIIEGIRQGVYDAVVSGMRQSNSNGGVGNVYLDGRKVGIATAKSSHGEMVRTSLVKVNR